MILSPWLLIIIFLHFSLKQKKFWWQINSLPEIIQTVLTQLALHIIILSNTPVKFHVVAMCCGDIVLYNGRWQLENGHKLLVNLLCCGEAIWWQIWINIGSGNGLLPDSTKPLPESMLTNHLWGLVVFTSQEMCNIYIYIYSYDFENYSLKITAAPPSGKWVIKCDDIFRISNW